MFGESPFENKGDKKSRMRIPSDAEIIFIADLFVDDYVGGAELTSEALISSTELKVCKILSKDLTIDLLEQGHQKYWIFGNYSQLDHNLIPTIISNLNYSILEYDYKYCKWRSPEKHEAIDGVVCNCQNDMNGKMVSAFMYGAKSLWWMSEKQMEKYHLIYPFLAELDNTVLSSVFDDAFFITVKMLREKYKDVECKGWIVLGSTSWIKGIDDARSWCIENDKEYEIISNLPYETVLEKLARAEGFVYLPKGGDTCPRMVIEAKLLGCELHINDNVEHATELWFDTDDMFDTEAYLYAAREMFWNNIKRSMEWVPALSGYTTTLNCISQHYPWEASISSMLGTCDEVIVVDGGSTDGTWEKLEKWAEEEERLKVHQSIRDWNHPRHGVFDGEQKAYARSLCIGEYCWQQDCDEVIHENDHGAIEDLLRAFPKQVDIVCLPVVEFWGKEGKVRMDVTPWKWRVSRNKKHITHGIPADMRKVDEEGNLYACVGTDGCDYIHNETHVLLPHASFYHSEAHNLRVHALSGNEEAFTQYQQWFENNVTTLPSVYHYSWYDLGRKIRTYRDYWSTHWQSLYNIHQADTAENNMFFLKPWNDVSEEEIDALVDKLSTEMGGWVFHDPVNFDKPTPHLDINITHPQVINEWISR